MLLNAFSLNMLTDLDVNVRVTGIDIAEARRLLLAEAAEDGGDDEIVSAVGHADTAAVFGDQLGLNVPCRRMTVEMGPGDWAVVGQYKGPRLPEGATALPEGSAIVWLKIEISV